MQANCETDTAGLYSAAQSTVRWEIEIIFVEAFTVLLTL